MPTLIRTLYFGFPVLFVVLAVPLVLRAVPPNRFYGYRTARSLASPEIWYQANFLTGVALTAAGIFMLCTAIGIETWAAQWTDAKRLLVVLLLHGSVISLALFPVILKIEG